MSAWTGVTVMAAHEFKLRLRAGRWKWLLLAWFAVLLAFTALEYAAIGATVSGNRGTTMFGGLMLVVLALGLLVVPALTAQSVNGDRERGVLASVQTTLLTPSEIALGKLAAAWGVALVFLATTLPLVGWCILAGGVGVGRALVTLIVVGLLLGVLAAVALCLSSLMARSTTSVVLSYLAVFAMTIGTVVVFGLAVAATQTTETVRDRQPVISPSGEIVDGEFEEYSYTAMVAHPERFWWVIAPNPFAVLADAAPRTVDSVNSADPLAGISEAVRSTRDRDSFNGVGGTDEDRAPVWPYGLGINLLIGAGAVALTARRLRTPYRQLPKAVRVA